MLFVGIPTYNGQIHYTTVQGLMQTAHMCAKTGIGIAVDIIPHDAFIGRARSTICKRFLDSGANDLLFVDADVGFTSPDVIAVCRPDADVVMGLYRMKLPETEKVKYPAMMTDPIERHPTQPDLIKLQYGPAGFMRVRRRVIEAMVAKWPDDWFEDAATGRIHDLFPSGRKGNFFLGEDIAFCQKVKECGFEIYAAQGLHLKHAGEWSWDSTWQIDIPMEKAA